jgi:hypothetical protein
MTCLYASDYGPADPGFDPLAGGGRLLRGFDSQRSELARAQNLGQLQATPGPRARRLRDF